MRLAGRHTLELLGALLLLAALLAPIAVGSGAFAVQVDPCAALETPDGEELLPTLEDADDPTCVSGNPSCASQFAGSVEYKIDGNPTNGGWGEDTPAEVGPGDGVELTAGATTTYVTIANADGTFFDHSVDDLPGTLVGVIVKGGNAANVYDPSVTTGLHAPVNASGGHAALSHVSFCVSLDPVVEGPVSASLSVAKTVDEGANNPDSTTTGFAFTVDCGEERTADFTLAHDETWNAPDGWELIVGDTCTVTETDTRNADTVSATWNGADHTLGTATALTAENAVVVTNRYEDVPVVVEALEPGIELEKAASTSEGLETEDGTPLVFFDPSDDDAETITWTLVVRNTGEVDLMDVVVIDEMLSPTAIPVADVLAVGEEATIAIDFEVTEDTAADTLTNVATAFGHHGDAEVSSTDESTVAIDRTTVEGVVTVRPQVDPEDEDDVTLPATGAYSEDLATAAIALLALGAALLVGTTTPASARRRRR